MAINITNQPTANGKYSCYYPLKFEATEVANNPDYLYFLIRNSDGTLIENVPYYKSSNISNVFYFDASSYLKAIFDVKSKQGKLTNAIEELTDIFGKYEVIVNTTPDTTGAIVSNEFYCLASLSNERYQNNETANYPIMYKGLHYSNDFTNQYVPKIMGKHSSVTLFVRTNYLYLETYTDLKPNSNSLIKESIRIDLTSYVNKLITIPLTKSFIYSNFTNTFTNSSPLKFNTFAVVKDAHRMYYKLEENNCNLNEFVYINKYGNKENIFFKTRKNLEIKTDSELFKSIGYEHTGNENTFNTSADTKKINQKIEKIYLVDGQKILRKYESSVLEFLTSPITWLVGEENISINIIDGSYTITKDDKGLEISFKYTIAQDIKTYI